MSVRMCRSLSAELLPRQPVPTLYGVKNVHLSLLNVTRFIMVHSTSLSKSQRTVLEHVNYSPDVSHMQI